jgi:hypothetical protein
VQDGHAASRQLLWQWVFYPDLSGPDANPCISVHAITRAALLQGYGNGGKGEAGIGIPEGLPLNCRFSPDCCLSRLAVDESLADRLDWLHPAMENPYPRHLQSHFWTEDHALCFPGQLSAHLLLNMPVDGQAA